MALFARIWVTVNGVNLAVLSLFACLAILQFDSISTTLLGERLGVLASRTAAPFSATARIGLPLSTVRNAEALLERARQTDSQILAIHVFDADNRIVHSTMNAAPARIPPEAHAAVRSAGSQRWYSTGDDGLYGGTTITDSAGNSVGGIVIVYPPRSNAVEIQAMIAELGLAVIGIVLISSVVCAGLLRVGLARAIGLFNNMDAEIAAFERDAWRSAAGADASDDTAVGSLRRGLDTAEDQYRSTGLTLAPERDRPPKDDRR